VTDLARLDLPSRNDPSWTRSREVSLYFRERGHCQLVMAVSCCCFVIWLGGWLSGCGTGNPYPPGTFDRGAHFNAHGKHHEAVEALEQFIRHNPTDSLAARAQYLKALSYIEVKEYPLAAVELQILRKDYPTSELVEDAFFQEGIAYFRQVGRVERDLSGAHQARSHFRRFLELYPASPHMAQVQEYLDRISDLVVRKRLGMAEVYRHLGRHRAAGLVLETTLAEETGSKLLDRVLLRRAELALKEGRPEVATAAYQRLLREYPDSPHVDAARDGLERLETVDDR
jgi:outer membrane protein assembly factor BamD